MSKNIFLTYFLHNLLCHMQTYSTDSHRLNPGQVLILLEGELTLSHPEKSHTMDIGEIFESGLQSFSIESHESQTKYLILTTCLDSLNFAHEADELSLALIDEDFFDQPKSELYKNASAQYLLQRIAQNDTIPSSGKPDSLIEQILQFIQNNLEEKLSVELITSEFKLSKMQIVRLFAKEGKQPIMTEVRSLRLSKASALLERSEISIQQIAASIGFADSASFSHFFKKNTGKSPRQIRDEQKWLI
ncbi:AraC family transcriptional regulator [Lentisphaera profundi]|uniref:AraC family transcriptional regulator n=1 Tax=Lentisphaera profundi TaxID=1658616 RepID=A0ABY7VN68_9BACT|nr:AraC family transcriptional regulator [Lentisphaera profundi]WDE95540.1 AraC family transcriptional regulator [Lentisphaera profundi]